MFYQKDILENMHANDIYCQSITNEYYILVLIVKFNLTQVIEETWQVPTLSQALDTNENLEEI